MCSHSSSSAAVQTLDELEFERGLWSAARSNDLERCKELLKKGNDPSKPDSSGFTCLHYAVRSASKDVVKCLLKHGVEVNAQTNAGKSTALHRACSKGRPEIVQILLAYKIDPNIQDADGRTALHLCFTEPSPTKTECAKLLHDVTEPNVTDKYGKTATDYQA